jgi:hypothetical protein
MASTSVMLNGFLFHPTFSADVFNNIHVLQNAFLIIIFTSNLVLDGYNKTMCLWEEFRQSSGLPSVPFLSKSLIIIIIIIIIIINIIIISIAITFLQGTYKPETNLVTKVCSVAAIL